MSSVLMFHPVFVNLVKTNLAYIFDVYFARARVGNAMSSFFLLK